MVIGTVKGCVWATKKDERLNGKKLMVVETDNRTIVATDSIGAGIGDRVLVCFGRVAKTNDNSPIDALIVGIIDSLEQE